MDGPVAGEAPLEEELPTPVGVVMFEPRSPGGLPLPSKRDGSMVLVRVKEPLTVLATRVTDELKLATRELALATPVPLLIGGK